MRIVLRLLLILVAATAVGIFQPAFEIPMRLLADMARLILVLRFGILIDFMR